MKKWIVGFIAAVILIALTVAPFVDERFRFGGGLTYSEMEERAQQFKDYYGGK